MPASANRDRQGSSGMTMHTVARVPGKVTRMRYCHAVSRHLLARKGTTGVKERVIERDEEPLAQ